MGFFFLHYNIYSGRQSQVVDWPYSTRHRELSLETPEFPEQVIAALVGLSTCSALSHPKNEQIIQVCGFTQTLMIRRHFQIPCRLYTKARGKNKR